MSNNAKNIQKQKFYKGDHVKIDDVMPKCMSHFPAGEEAIIIGSYKDQYGGGNINSYTIHIKGRGEVSWYEENQLTLIESSRIDLLEAWESEERQLEEKYSSIDWIFENVDMLSKTIPSQCAITLAKCLGINNLWGANGEGFVFMQNAVAVMLLARPFLIMKDKDGWLAFCAKYQEAKS